MRQRPCRAFGDTASSRRPSGESRVFAECKAKRRIVEWAAPVLTNWPGAAAGARHVSDDGLDVLRILALPYADHPDYDEEWRP